MIIIQTKTSFLGVVFDVDHDSEGPRAPKAHPDAVLTNLSRRLGRPFTVLSGFSTGSTLEGNPEWVKPQLSCVELCPVQPETTQTVPFEICHMRVRCGARGDKAFRRERERFHSNFIRALPRAFPRGRLGLVANVVFERKDQRRPREQAHAPLAGVVHA